MLKIWNFQQSYCTTLRFLDMILIARMKVIYVWRVACLNCRSLAEQISVK